LQLPIATTRSSHQVQGFAVSRGEFGKLTGQANEVWLYIARKCTEVANESHIFIIDERVVSYTVVVLQH